MITFGAITPTLFVGSHPRSVIDVSRLRAAGISAVLNLQTDADMKALAINIAALSNYYIAQDIVVVRFPIRDFDPAAVEQHLGEAVEILHGLLGNGHRVYVHCTAGVQRSPTVVVAYLTWYHGWGLEQATAHVLEKHRCEPYVEVIENAVRQATRSESGGDSPQ